jgi:hypothetical protein
MSGGIDMQELHKRDDTIRELSGGELDQVAGGVTASPLVIVLKAVPNLCRSPEMSPLTAAVTSTSGAAVAEVSTSGTAVAEVSTAGTSAVSTTNPGLLLILPLILSI